MKVLKVLILLLLVKTSYGQTYSKFIKNFNVDTYNEIICDLPGKIKIEIWDEPTCQILLGVKINTEKESIVNYLISQNRYSIEISHSTIETHISLPNIKNLIMINGGDMEEDFISIIRVPKNVFVSKKKETLFQ
jgi:hypothetical protein